MKKGSLWAWLPIFVFLALFIGFGVITGDFYLMPAPVGFLIALVVAFFQNPKMNLNEKLSLAAKGAGNENIMIMCLVFLLAGAFSGSVTAAGGAISAVNFGLSILPTNVAVVGIFIIGCLISISMGTSVGTVVALTPIAVGISDKAGIPIALCVGAVVCGAMFGDNLSMISDTTIAATRTQGCEMNDKFKENFKIVLPAAVLTLVIFLALTFNTSYVVEGDLRYDIIRILPYALVLITALLGVNVFIVLSLGTVFSICVGLFYGDFAFLDVFGVIGSGMNGMFEITIISIIVGAVFALIKENGGIEYVITGIKNSVKSKKGAEFGIAAMSLATDVATANNTVAIVIAGPIAKEISDEFEISPKRAASILDIFTSVGQGIIPYGAQVLTAASLAAISPIEAIPYLFYPMLMAVSAICFIAFGKEK
ncbi:Na+/H+ antiporter NhaC family protein [Chakrabartyella piscis]|uniref:Na+/H+ antiporter NhaC family protein n=1 Tax=Chakrabartyella piscis TaxID=2918914 RepID=UPI002958CD15|nr:Na+/H+ antiporter NhaC family protein [Chakrabartyella piscis]